LLSGREAKGTPFGLDPIESGEPAM